MNEERLQSIVIAEAYRGIKVNDGDKQVTVSMAEAILRSMALKAAKGDHRSQKLFSDLLRRTEIALKAQHDDWLEKAFDYKVKWERELERRTRLGITAPDPLPHPDDIEIDMNTGSVAMRGPFTKEQRAVWIWLAERRNACDEEIRAFEQELAQATDRKTRRFFDDQIAIETALRETIVSIIGIWPNRDPMALHQHRARMKREERKTVGKRR